MESKPFQLRLKNVLWAMFWFSVTLAVFGWFWATKGRGHAIPPLVVSLNILPLLISPCVAVGVLLERPMVGFIVGALVVLFGFLLPLHG